MFLNHIGFMYNWVDFSMSLKQDWRHTCLGQLWQQYAIHGLDFLTEQCYLELWTIYVIFKFINPWTDNRCQFHQCSTSSFYAHRSRKRKKTVKLSVFFAAHRTLMKLTLGPSWSLQDCSKTNLPLCQSCEWHRST